MGEERLVGKDVLDIASTFPYEPLFNRVFITLNKMEEDGELVLSDNILDEIQYVVAGSFEWNGISISPGDKVLIDIEKLMIPVRQESTNSYETQMQVKIDPVEVDGIPYGLINDRVIKAKINN